MNEEINTSEPTAEAPTDAAEMPKPQPPKPQPGDAAYPDRIIDIDPDKRGQRRHRFR